MRDTDAATGPVADDSGQDEGGGSTSAGSRAVNDRDSCGPPFVSQVRRHVHSSSTLEALAVGLKMRVKA